MLILEKNLIIIKNYHEIKIFHSGHIALIMDDNHYEIKGENLRMVYYDRYEIRFTGDLKVIRYGI